MSGWNEVIEADLGFLGVVFEVLKEFSLVGNFLVELEVVDAQFAGVVTLSQLPVVKVSARLLPTNIYWWKGCRLKKPKPSSKYFLYKFGIIAFIDKVGKELVLLL